MGGFTLCSSAGGVYGSRYCNICIVMYSTIVDVVMYKEREMDECLSASLGDLSRIH